MKKKHALNRMEIVGIISCVGNGRPVSNKQVKEALSVLESDNKLRDKVKLDSGKTYEDITNMLQAKLNSRPLRHY